MTQRIRVILLFIFKSNYARGLYSLIFVKKLYTVFCMESIEKHFTVCDKNVLWHMAHETVLNCLNAKVFSICRRN